MKYFKVKNFNKYNSKNFDNIRIWGKNDNSHYQYINFYITDELFTENELKKELLKYSKFVIDGDYIRKNNIDIEELKKVLFDIVEVSSQKTFKMFGVRKVSE